LVDLNGDGHHDILSGSYSRMSQPMAGLFQVLWGQAEGSFKKAAVLEGTDGKPLIIPADEDNIIENICTRPTAVDWDGDRDLDLVVGNFAGSFYLFTGQGKGKFLPQPKQIMTEDGPLKIEGAHSDPFPVDWDGDGDLDLLSGSSNGGVQWAENVAGAGGAPALKPFRDLIKQDQKVEYGKPLDEADLAGPTGSTRVWVEDMNADGKLDLLVGDTVNLVSAAKGLSQDEFRAKQEQWRKDLAAVSQEYAAAEGDAAKQREARAKLQKLYAERSQFMTEDMTGFVWLYLQK
jgi:hypothetical protein